MSTLQEFCGLSSNASFVVYDDINHMFGRCFLWTAISNACYFIYSVQCAYILGVSKSFSSQRRSLICICACVISLLIACSSLIEVILCYLLEEREEHPPAYVLAKGVSFTAWLLCFLLQCRVTSITMERKQNSRYLLISLLLVVFSSSAQLQLILTIPEYAETFTVHYFGQIIDFSLTILYLLISILIGLSKVTSVQAYNTLEDESIQEGRGEEKTIYLGPSESSKNILPRLLFWWTDRLLKKGMKKQLKTPDDLFLLPDSLNTTKLKEILSKKLKKTKEELLSRGGTAVDENFQHGVKKKSLNISLFKVLNQCFGKEYYSLAILKLLYNACELVQPLLVNLLVTYVSDRTEPMKNGFYYALGFFLTSLFSVVIDQHYLYGRRKVNMKLRASLVTVIYEKTLAIRASSMSKFSTGKIVNLMSTDTDRVRGFCGNFHECWSVPFHLIVCLYLLYHQVGLAVLSTIGYCVLIVPIAQQLSKKIKDLEVKMLAARDKRIKIMCEVLFGIRIIKYNAWEPHFTKTVNEARDPELRYRFISMNMIGGVICVWGMSVSVMSILTIGTYVLMGYPLTAAKVFTCMAIIDQIVNPLNSFSWNTNNLIDAWVSLKRIQAFLCLPEMELDEYYTSERKEDSSLAVSLNEGSFRWSFKEDDKEEEDEAEAKGGCCCKPSRKEDDEDKEEEEENVNPFELKNVTCSIHKGQFLGITGKVGAGKSSLFATITAEMEKEGGEVYLDANLNGVALVTQEPWIQHMSIRDNIMFGREYDEERYNNVLYTCALNDDLHLFSAGDLTEIGERGVNLSGGQKARVALARAVYQEKDMYLLDDPIAAVDAHVAKHIYVHCINGLLKDKTRVLCTHHTNYLQQCDHVIVMEDGVIQRQGPPGEVLKDLDVVGFNDKREVEANKKESEKKEKNDNEKNADEGKLVDDEESRVGTVAFEVYKLYCSSYGTYTSVIVFLTIASWQVCENVQDWWLSYWVSHTGNTNNTDFNTTTMTMLMSRLRLNRGFSDIDEYYLSIYAYIVGAYLFFLCVRVVLHAIGCIKASKRLHCKLLDAVMATPVSFFDITPVGRIINRFSNDLSAIDDDIPFTLQFLAVNGFSLIGTLAITCYSLPWFAVLLLPLVLVYYYIQLVYRMSSRELKRISSVSRSPIYEHFTETLSGCMAIRAFREKKRFIQENNNKLESNQRSEYNELMAYMWLKLRLNMIGVLMVTSVSLLAVLEHHYGGINPGLVGLAITYAVRLTPLLGDLLMTFAENEKQMVRVERIAQYIQETPQERRKSKDVPPTWPHTGRIKFDNIFFKYRENLPYALQDVSLDIKPGEKIGICGRTGSGKSSLLKVVFNIVDVTSGSVQIDGLDINDVDHSILRSRMSIIPQDPFLFNDTVAKNLDPAESFATHEMMDVIEKCHLTRLVQDLGGLEGKVGEKGSNLSAGQKQLLCLARALLKKSKIICIDEATASVDLETDKLIQVTIREGFASNTVLTIAHRMNTIIDNDRVLVMDAGRVLEFAPPDELLADPNTEFYSLVNENTSTN